MAEANDAMHEESLTDTIERLSRVARESPDELPNHVADLTERLRGRDAWSVVSHPDNFGDDCLMLEADVAGVTATWSAGVVGRRGKGDHIPEKGWLMIEGTLDGRSVCIETDDRTVHCPDYDAREEAQESLRQRDERGGHRLRSY